jgi:hypothetical protein
MPAEAGCRARRSMFCCLLTSVTVRAKGNAALPNTQPLCCEGEAQSVGPQLHRRVPRLRVCVFVGHSLSSCGPWLPGLVGWLAFGVPAAAASLSLS